MKAAKQLIIKELARVLIEHYQLDAVPVVTAAERPGFGEFTSSVALEHKLPPAPRRAAEEIAGRLNLNGVAIAEVAGPGFLNFRLTPEYLGEALKQAAAGKPEQPRAVKKETIIVEFVSANPTGPLTLPSARGGFIGDVLTNILVRVGHRVHREYFINDAGNQITELGKAVAKRLGGTVEGEVQYNGAYVDELAKKLKPKIKDLGRFQEIGRSATAVMVKEFIQPTLKRAGIRFDSFYAEYAELHEKGLIRRVLDELAANAAVYEQEGALFIRTAEFGDERDRVLIKSNGQFTYLAGDLPYHVQKLRDRKFDRAINVFGADSSAELKSLKAGLHFFGLSERLEFIVHQIVRLIRGGKELKMSKRTGTFVTLDELLDEAGSDAARFFFVMRSPDSHMDFDLDLAKEQSKKNPVYYLQYSYARLSGILKKAGTLPKQFNPATLKSDEERALIVQLLRYPLVIEEAAERRLVHLLPQYGLELAEKFHKFYDTQRVLGAEKSVEAARLALVTATQKTLKDLFTLIGITAPEKM